MSKLYSHFCQFMDDCALPQGSRCVLALSGGIDSRVMLHLLAQYVKEQKHARARDYPVMAVHVHHGLSPSAGGWAERCREWCVRENISFQVNYVVLDRHPGHSLEASARQARYDVLRSYIRAGDLLLTGQHSDDQLETFLLALKRGSGPKGLSCMGERMPFGEGQLVRPFLKISRKMIEAYAVMHQLSWVEDESNQDTRFDRNFIRHEIAPLLLHRWPDLSQSVQRSAELCARQELLLNTLLQDVYARVSLQNDSLSVSGLLTLDENVCAQILRMWFDQLGRPMPSRVQLSHLIQQVLPAKSDANPRLRLGEYEVRRFSGALFCIPVYDDLSQWQCDIQLNQMIELPDGLGQLTLAEMASGGQIAKDQLKEPLWISFNPEGLTAHPVGRSRGRKLKKLFQEYQIPSWQRRRFPILMCGRQVVSVANLFVEKHFYGSECDLIWDTTEPSMTKSQSRNDP